MMAAAVAAIVAVAVAPAGIQQDSFHRARSGQGQLRLLAVAAQTDDCWPGRLLLYVALLCY